MKSTRLVIAAAALVAAGSAFASPTQVTADIVQASQSAEFSRADLQTEVGAKAAYAHLRSLARRVCTDGEAARNVGMFQAQECTAKALDAAVKELGSSTVEQLHSAKFN
jgi:UrcA family protein